MLDEESTLQLFADSTFYEEIFNESKNEKIFSVIRENLNITGPLCILRIFNGNRYFVYFFNILILFISLILIAESYAKLINCSFFTFLICINPICFTSMLSVNKESISILAISCLIVAVKKMKKKFLASLDAADS